MQINAPVPRGPRPDPTRAMPPDTRSEEHTRVRINLSARVRRILTRGRCPSVSALCSNWHKAPLGVCGGLNRFQRDMGIPDECQMHDDEIESCLMNVMI